MRTMLTALGSALVTLPLMTAMLLAQYEGNDPPSKPIASPPLAVPSAADLSRGIPNILVDDDYNMLQNPASLLRFGTAYAELWNGRPWGGATFPLPLGFKAAVFLGKPYSGFLLGRFNQTADSVAYTPPSPWPAPNYTAMGLTTAGSPHMANINLGVAGLSARPIIDILIGRRLVGSLAAGIKYGLYTTRSVDTVEVKRPDGPPNPDDGTMNNTRSYQEHTVTAGLAFGDKGFTLDAAVDMILFSLDLSYTERQTGTSRFADISLRSTGSPAWNFLVRPALRLSDNARIVSSLNLYLRDASTELLMEVDADGGGVNNHGVDRSGKETYANRTVGGSALFALHTSPRDDLRIITSSGLEAEQVSLKNTQTSWGTNDRIGIERKVSAKVPAAVSLEYEPVEDLKLRFGLSAYLFDSLAEQNAFEQARFRSYAPLLSRTVIHDPLQNVRTSAGLGYRWKDFEANLAFAVNTYNWNTLISAASLKYHY